MFVYILIKKKKMKENMEKMQNKMFNFCKLYGYIICVYNVIEEAHTRTRYICYIHVCMYVFIIS